VTDENFFQIFQTDMQFSTNDNYKNLLRRFEVRENPCGDNHFNYGRKYISSSTVRISKLIVVKFDKISMSRH
jgi:hypothetical protein